MHETFLPQLKHSQIINGLLMKKLIFAVLFSIASFFASAETISPKVQQEIESTMNSSVACWNKGDLPCFMDYYVKSDDLLFISGTKFIHGWDNINQRYKERYGNNTKQMGQLQLKINGMQQLDPSHVFLYGQFHLEIESKNYDGVTSLIFVKSAGKWKIMSDHSN